MAGERRSGMFDCVTLSRGDHAGSNQFGSAFEMREHGTGSDFISAIRGYLDDLTTSVSVPGDIES
jgi:hypothetical protein